MKKAILSIDVEDWYHLDYFNRAECDTKYTMLDGLDIYINFLQSLSLPSSFFVLGEIAEKNIDFYKNLVKDGHDVSSHGWDHQRPMTMRMDDFKNDLHKNFKIMKKINGNQEFGYRAPCFSIDRDRLDLVKNSGFSYDSSRIDFSNHPLYGSIDMNGYKNFDKNIYINGKFVEFETTTTSFMGRNIPISGGGYLRIFPWFFMKNLISNYLSSQDLFVFYIHPFELSQLASPEIPKSSSIPTKIRFNFGRNKVLERLNRLIDLLDSKDYSFTTFSKMRSEIVIKCEK